MTTVQVDLSAERTASEIESPPHRVDSLRARTLVSSAEPSSSGAVSKSPFVTTAKNVFGSKTMDTALPSIELLPFGLRGHASGQVSGTIQFVSGGALAASGLALGIHVSVMSSVSITLAHVLDGIAMSIKTSTSLKKALSYRRC